MIHAAATSVAIAAGTFALVAMLFGSPLSFGLALAVSSAGWIVAHFVERVTEQDQAIERRRRMASAQRPWTTRRPSTAG